MRKNHLTLVPRVGEDEQVWIVEVDRGGEAAPSLVDLTRSCHRQYLFVYAGKAEAKLDGWVVPLVPGDIAFVPSKTVADVRWEPGSQAVWIGIADDFLMSRVVPALGVPFAMFRSEFNTPKKISDWTGDAHSADRARLWGELAEARRRLNPVGNTVVAAYVLIMLFENSPTRATENDELQAIGAVSMLSEDSTPDRDVSIAMAFRSLLEQHLVDKWSVRQYCACLKIRSIDLVDSCKKVLGCTPSELISDRLLLEAKRQLTYSNTPSAAIAYDLGFNDAAYFSRFFKRQTGLSPSEFRRGHAHQRAL